MKTDPKNRRNRIDLFNPAETAIYKAQQEVEKMPADVRLTNAGCLLQDARTWVADFIENIPIAEHYPRTIIPIEPIKEITETEINKKRL